MPSTPDFVHLHVHTMYSLLDGAIWHRRSSSASRSSACQPWPSPITAPCSGVLEFYEKRQGRHQADHRLRMLRGAAQPRDKTPLDAKGVTHLVLLAENQEGYRNLCKLATIAQLEGFYYKPRIDKEVLRAHSKGLIALSACLHGEIPRIIRENRSKGRRGGPLLPGALRRGQFFSGGAEQRHRHPGAGQHRPCAT
jgi:DNA polymerase III subunit alpha